jgi:hypothetical protein
MLHIEELPELTKDSYHGCSDCFNVDNESRPAICQISFPGRWYVNPVKVCLTHLLARVGTFVELLK